MSALNKYAAKDYLSAPGTPSRSLLRRTPTAHYVRALELKPEISWAKRPAFLEDFIVEHSLPGLEITSIEMAGSF